MLFGRGCNFCDRTERCERHGERGHGRGGRWEECDRQTRRFEKTIECRETKTVECREKRERGSEEG